jgi:hypothetical protein
MKMWVKRLLTLIRCMCHSLQLAVSAAAKEFLPKTLEFYKEKPIIGSHIQA